MLNLTDWRKSSSRSRQDRVHAEYGTGSEKPLSIKGTLVDSSSAPPRPAPTKPVPLPPLFDPLVDSFDLPDEDVFDPRGPQAHQVILLTASDGRSQGNGIGTVPNLYEQVMENRDDFCDHHGYIHHVIDLSDYDLGPNVPAVRPLSLLSHVKVRH